MAVEICFLFGKTIILLLSDHVNAGSGYFSFFFNRELFPIVRLHIYILLHFTFEFSGAAIPIPRPKILLKYPILGHIWRSNGLFPRAFFKKDNH